jgi:hypothetical protein
MEKNARLGQNIEKEKILIKNNIEWMHCQMWQLLNMGLDLNKLSKK